MNELNQQQNDTTQQHNPNKEERQGMAIAALVMGVLSILMFITIIVPFVFGILAIIFGVLSLKNRKKGVAISGIITGAIGLLLAVLIIIAGITGSVLSKKSEVVESLVETSVEVPIEAPVETLVETSVESSDISENIGDLVTEKPVSSLDKTFYGNGFALTYSEALWTPLTIEGADGDLQALQYVLDETTLIHSGVSGMLGHTLSTSAGRDKMYKEFYDILENLMNTANTYIADGTETFEVLNNDIYYASYCIYNKNNEELAAKAYVIASEHDDIVVSFSARLGQIAKFDPDIPIKPILESIIITDSPVNNEMEAYEEKVWESEDEYKIGDSSIPSLSQIMDNNTISYLSLGGEKTIGRMIIPSIANYHRTPDMVSVEIIEVTYQDVEDAWEAIDAYGRLLNESYDFRVTYPPSDYPKETLIN